MEDAGHITALLAEAGNGNRAALDEAVGLIYDDLRRLAAARIHRQFGARGAALTLQPTALVNETYFRLLRQRVDYASREHFLAIATRLMLRVLIDYRRADRAQKRGGDQVRVGLTGIPGTADNTEASADAEALLAAIGRLENLDARKADVIRLRAVWGFEMTEIAETLDVSLATVERDWRFAKSWLADELAS